jgi:hypothetical protein
LSLQIAAPPLSLTGQGTWSQVMVLPTLIAAAATATILFSGARAHAEMADAGAPAVEASGGARPAPTPAPKAPTPERPSGAPPAEPSGGRPMLRGEIKASLRGAFIVNLCYNDGSLFPGSFAYYAIPPALSQSGFFISPSNTILGFKMEGLWFGSAEISGAMDVNLRSPKPLEMPNSLLPQFYDVHMQIDFERWRVIAGQYRTIILPIIPDTTNSFPTGYVPGALGYVEPQLRIEARFPIGGAFQAITQGSLNRPLPTFELAEQLRGRQAGSPDVQGRVAIALGESERPWERPFEVGLSAHFGSRKATSVSDLQDHLYRTWSVGGDLRAQLPTGTMLKGRIFTGSALGSFAAGIFQIINPRTFQAIRAKGLWVEAQQRLAERWRATIGYGRDDPKDADLEDGDRTLSQELFLNVMWDVTKTIGFGLEGSRWATSYKGSGTAKVWRGDLIFLLRF